MWNISKNVLNCDKVLNHLNIIGKGLIVDSEEVLNYNIGITNTRDNLDIIYSFYVNYSYGKETNQYKLIDVIVSPSNINITIYYIGGKMHYYMREGDFYKKHEEMLNDKILSDKMGYSLSHIIKIVEQKSGV